jgi:predicted HicB family RNase H-like nuclease
MKRIVNGVTYNTDTATQLATSSREDDGKITETLYQTRGGAFFLHRQTVNAVWNEEDRSKHIETDHAFRPQSPEDAHKWILTGDVEVLRNPFDDPPEAEAEAEPGATIYIRVPASLKRAVDEAAKTQNVSGNVWAMRCVERCLSEDKALKRTLGNIEFALKYLDTENHRLEADERFRVYGCIHFMIERRWREFFGKPSDVTSLQNHITSFADDQIDEFIESAVQNS